MFVAPEMNVIKFAVEDIITTSIQVPGGNGGVQLPDEELPD